MHIFCYVVYIWHRLPFCQDFITAHSSLSLTAEFILLNKYSPWQLIHGLFRNSLDGGEIVLAVPWHNINSQSRRTTLAADITSQLDTKKERHLASDSVSGLGSIIEEQKTLRHWTESERSPGEWWHCILFNLPRIRQTFENLFGRDAIEWWKHNWGRRNKTDFLESWRGTLHFKMRK